MYIVEIQINVWLETDETVWYTDQSEASIRDSRSQFSYMEEGELRQYMRDTWNVKFFRKDKADKRDIHEFLSDCFGVVLHRVLKAEQV